MNVRYGAGYTPLYPSAPPAEAACIMCSHPATSWRTFPCSCNYPIHEQCVISFRRSGGVCPKCHQVWIPMDNDALTDNTLGMTRSQKEWIIAQDPRGSQLVCGIYRGDSWKNKCCCTWMCIFLIGAAILCTYLLIKVYG